ncbi:MAG: hypothetical protein ABJI96_18445 [Paracoccaceae bacterium]
MIRALIVFLLFVPGLCSPASGGAWLREDDTGFTAFSSTNRVPKDLSFLNSDNSFYVEYGVTGQTTLGADLNYATVWDGLDMLQEGHAILFLRRPIGRADRSMRFAYELGIGTRYRLLEWEGVLKLGLSMGKGIETGLGNGWIAVDGSVEFEDPSGGRLTKLDATFGISVSPRVKTMLQIQSSYRSKDIYNVDVIPSIVWELKPKSYMLLGVEARHSRTKTYGLKVGFWRDF